MSRSGSGRPAVPRREPSVSSSICSGVSRPGSDVVGERAAGVDDLRAAAVVQRDVERHAAAGRGRREALRELLLNRCVELVHPADDAEPDVVLQEVRELAVQVLLQKRHERDDLEPRALPVLDGEGVERQRVELEPRAGLDDLADGRDAGAVALDARRAALAGPAAVAVHDDGDVPRQPGQVDLVEERALRRAGAATMSRSITCRV